MKNLNLMQKLVVVGIIVLLGLFPSWVCGTQTHAAREKIRVDAVKMAAEQGLDMTPGSTDHRLFYTFMIELANTPKHEYLNKPLEEQVKWVVNKVKAGRPGSPPPVAQVPTPTPGTLPPGVGQDRDHPLPGGFGGAKLSTLPSGIAPPPNQKPLPAGPAPKKFIDMSDLGLGGSAPASPAPKKLISLSDVGLPDYGGPAPVAPPIQKTAIPIIGLLILMVLAVVFLIFYFNQRLPWLGERLGEATRRFKKPKDPHAIFKQERLGPIEGQEAGVYAGFWKRVGAYFIDVVVLFIILVIFFFWWGFLGFPTSPKETFEGLVFLISLIFLWIYFATMESSKHQATLGKMAMNIVVTGMEKKPISIRRASGRYVAKAVPFVILIIFSTLITSFALSIFNKQEKSIFLIFFAFLALGVLIIINLMPAFTRKKQGLHDIMAGTLVLNKESAYQPEDIKNVLGTPSVAPNAPDTPTEKIPPQLTMTDSQKSEQEKPELIEKQEREVLAPPVEGKRSKTVKNLSLMQKRIMLVGVAVIVLMGLFPPWIETTTTTTKDILHGTFHTNSVETVAGYYFLSNAPRGGKDIWDAITTYHLDFGRLLIQWFFVSLSTAALMFYFKE